MIFLAIFGILMLILSAFYLVNSWQQYGQWKWATFLVIISLTMTVVGGYGMYENHQNEANNKTTSQTAAKTSTSAISLSGAANQMNANQETKENAILGQLQKAYGKLGTVGFDSQSKTYQIKPASGDEAKALQAVLDDNSQANQIGWPKLTKSLDETSSQLQKILGDGYSLSLIQPNSDQPMYTVKNGQETYSAVK